MQATVFPIASLLPHLRTTVFPIASLLPTLAGNGFPVASPCLLKAYNFQGASHFPPFHLKNKNNMKTHPSNKSTTSRILAYMNKTATTLFNRQHIGLAQNYTSTHHSFSRFLQTQGKQDLPFSKITSELLTLYQEWLWQQGIKKNTSSFYLRNLHSVFNKKEGLTTGNPFATVYTGVAKTRKRAVTPDLIRHIHQLDIRQGLIHIGKNPKRKTFDRTLRELSFARDTFIFCFCARGLTFVDLAFLKKENIWHNTLRYKRRKTGQTIEVEILPCMQTIIERYPTSTPYLFPILHAQTTQEAYHEYRTAIRKYNKQLNTLSLMLSQSIPLTSYVSRHSWATAAYHQNIPIAYISEAMGHHSEKTTRTYLKSLESNKIDKANRQLLHTIFNDDGI